MLLRYAQPLAMRGYIRVILGEFSGVDFGVYRINVQRPEKHALTPIESPRDVTQTFEHRSHVIEAELSAYEPVQDKAVLEDRHVLFNTLGDCHSMFIHEIRRE